MAGSDVIQCIKGGATASVKFIFICNPCRAKTAEKWLWCSRFQFLIVLSMVGFILSPHQLNKIDSRNTRHCRQ